MFVIATTSPPARRMRSATTLSSAGTKPWRIARAAGERDPGDRDRVLDGDPPPGQNALVAVAAHAAEADDRVQRILAGVGPTAGFAHGVDRRD